MRSFLLKKYMWFWGLCLAGMTTMQYGAHRLSEGYAFLGISILFAAMVFGFRTLRERRIYLDEQIRERARQDARYALGRR